MTLHVELDNLDAPLVDACSATLEDLLEERRWIDAWAIADSAKDVLIPMAQYYLPLKGQLLDVWMDYYVCWDVYYGVAVKHGQYRFLVLTLIYIIVSNTLVHYVSRHPWWTYPLYLLGLSPVLGELLGRAPIGKDRNTMERMRAWLGFTDIQMSRWICIWVETIPHLWLTIEFIYTSYPEGRTVSTIIFLNFFVSFGFVFIDMVRLLGHWMPPLFFSHLPRGFVFAIVWCSALARLMPSIYVVGILAKRDKMVVYYVVGVRMLWRGYAAVLCYLITRNPWVLFGIKYLSTAALFSVIFYWFGCCLWIHDDSAPAKVADKASLQKNQSGCMTVLRSHGTSLGMVLVALQSWLACMLASGQYTMNLLDIFSIHKGDPASASEATISSMLSAAALSLVAIVTIVYDIITTCCCASTTDEFHTKPEVR